MNRHVADRLEAIRNALNLLRERLSVGHEAHVLDGGHVITLKYSDNYMVRWTQCGETSWLSLNEVMCYFMHGSHMQAIIDWRMSVLRTR